MISVLPHRKRGMLDLMVMWYPRKASFATWDRCSSRMEISMKILVIQLKLASSILCDPRVSLKLKGKFYRIVIRAVMLYEAKCWPNKM
jgi:hypothetical protein